MNASLLLLNSDYGAMKKTFKLNRFSAKVWTYNVSRHVMFTPYSRVLQIVQKQKSKMLI